MITRWEVYQLAKDKYNFKLTPAYSKDIARLKRGEPLAYVIGWTPFLNCKIDLSYKPLIPRPETEYWTKRLLETSKDTNIKILDLFSGSGCVGIALLKNHTKCRVDFADIKKNCLLQIKKNGKKNHIAYRRYRVIASNVFKAIAGRYDLIVANPPYIPTMRRVPASVTSHEPRAALFGKKDGLYYINKFLKEAQAHLIPGGQIWMEFDATHKSAVEKLLRRYSYTRYVFHRDQFKRWRYLTIDSNI